MRRESSPLFLIAIFIFVFSSISYADIIYLKNGDTLEGLITEETDKKVVIRLEIGTIVFSRNEIERIEKKPFIRAEAKAPRQEAARESLIEYKGRKYTKARFKRLIEQKGLIRYRGKWVTEHEKLGLELQKKPGAFNVRKITRYAAPAVVSVSIDESKLGSGVLINSNGLFITNLHVVKDAGKIKVKLSYDKTEFSARVVTSNDTYDLALVSMGGVDRPYLKLGDPDKISIGDPVIAMGNPFGLATTVTTGIISSVRKLEEFPVKNIEDVPASQRKITFIQTDAAINPGNSGGPLLNNKGEIIGINSMIISKSRSEGLNFAIHAKELKKIYSHYFE